MRRIFKCFITHTCNHPALNRLGKENLVPKYSVFWISWTNYYYIYNIFLLFVKNNLILKSECKRNGCRVQNDNI